MLEEAVDAGRAPTFRALPAGGVRAALREEAVDAGRSPTFGALLERGVLVPDCVSSFPSVTPVASAEIVTGVAADRHWISGMNWYHRLERRSVEDGFALGGSH